MSETVQTPVKSAFHWQGPSQTIDKFGRIKTERQILLDAGRVNKNFDLGAHGGVANALKGR